MTVPATSAPPVSSSPVSSSRQGPAGTVAVVLINSPPVNALGHAVRAGIFTAVQAAAADGTIKAIVLACAGRTFCAGADITEFGKPAQSPVLNEVIALIETVQKPVVAAMHGTILGGGLELTMGCHYRVATATARMGQPEVKLGFPPGGGGTQRLPRLIGMERALPMITSGDPIKADAALALGLVDEIATGDTGGDLTAAAVAFALAAAPRPLVRVRDRDDKIAQFRADPTKFDALAAPLLKRARGQQAVAACVEAVRNGLTMPFDDAIKAERVIFVACVNSDQSKAQRYAFFAEREAAKIPDMPAATKPRAIGRVAVIGAGTMGGGISMCFANVGIPVTLIETTDEPLKRGLALIAANYRATVAKGSLPSADAEARIGLISGAIGLDHVASADLIIEAVFEDMDLKKRIFATLDAKAKPGAILATNTSTLDVDAIAAATKRPGDVIGLHFFSPANVMKLLEIVRGKATAHDTLATALDIAKRIAKVPVVSGVCDGFIGNRMLAKRGIEAERLILEGALPAQVDKVCTDFGLPMGPFAMSDLAGIDVSWRINLARGRKSPVSDALAEMGRFGQKTGRGYYLYEAGSRVPKPDPDVTQLVLDASTRLGITRRQISDQEILERMIYPMINEGARILDEKIAMRASDIDVAWVYGYGWPVWRGGPMHYADSVGLAAIRDRLAAYAKASGDKTLEPAALLAKLAGDGKGFASLGVGGNTKVANPVA
jgi:3-hydroxyacyl-CoA dehydrogenase